MKKITDSAKGEDCTIRLPGISNRDSETVVYCHINGIRFGHGTGIKTEFGAYGCSDCHEVVDGRRKSNYNHDYIRASHLEGVIETLRKLNAKGLINL